MENDNYKVYILDDDPEDAELLEGAFKDSDCTSEVNCFNTTNKLLQQLFFLADKEVPDLIIMDHQMPLMDGSNLIKHIRADKKLRGITLGIYSSGIQQTKLEDMFSKGIDLFIAKGNTYDEMKDHVKKFCEAIQEKQLNGGG